MAVPPRSVCTGSEKVVSGFAARKMGIKRSKGRLFEPALTMLLRVCGAALAARAHADHERVEA